MEVSTKLRGGFKWVKKGVTTHIKMERRGSFPSSPIYWVLILLSLPHVGSSSCSLSLFPLLHRKSARLRRSPAEIFSPPPPPSSCVVGVPGGSSTSAAPLERGIGGRRQAARVTEYGSAAHLWHSSLRPWGRKVIVRHHPHLFAGTLSRLRSTRVSPSKQRFDRYLRLLDMILGFLWLQP